MPLAPETGPICAVSLCVCVWKSSVEQALLLTIYFRLGAKVRSASGPWAEVWWSLFRLLCGSRVSRGECVTQPKAEG